MFSSLKSKSVKKTHSIQVEKQSKFWWTPKNNENTFTKRDATRAHNASVEWTEGFEAL